MKLFNLFNKKIYLLGAVGVGTITLILGFFLNSFKLAILFSAIYYLLIFFLPLHCGCGMLLLLMPNVGVFDNSGFKYIFNFALMVFLIRILLECFIKKELLNKKNLIFIGLVAFIALYDLLNAFLSKTISLHYFANLNIWVTWVIFYLLLTREDFSQYKKTLFMLLVIGLIISFGLGLVISFRTWGAHWPDKYRFPGLLRDPNYLGLTCMLIISTCPFVLNGWYRYFAIAPVAAIGFMSISKMFIFVFVLYILCLINYDVFINKRNGRYLIFNGVVLIGSIFVITIILLTTDLLTKIETILSTRYLNFKDFDLDAITTGRTKIWREYFARLFENPHNFLLGRSLGYSDFYKISLNENNVSTIAHNTYYDLILSFGLIGIVAYVSLWILTLKNRKTTFEKNFNSISSLSTILLMIFGLSYLSADCLMIIFAYIFVFNSKLPQKDVVEVKEKVRVLHVVNSLSNANGIASLLVNYYRALLNKKYVDVQIDFLIQQPSESANYKCLSDLNAKIHVIPRPTLKNFLKSKKAYKQILRENSYDIVHCHLSNIAFFYLGIADKNGVKHRILHAHSSRWSGSAIKRFLHYILSQQGLFYTTDCLACSNVSGKFLFKKRNFSIIPNAIEPSRYSFSQTNRNKIRKLLKISDTTLLIGNIGRLSTEKNQKFLIDTLFELVVNKKKDAKLVVLGNGPLHEQLLNYAKERNMQDRAMILGDVTNANEFYSAFDVLLLPSLYEGLPVVGVEAQFNSLPILVSSNITKEMVFSNSVKFIENFNASTWADEILNTNRKNFMLNKEKAKYFDVDCSISLLRRKYLNIAGIPGNFDKKVGIMTMHRVINFGSFLQAYSLKNVIEQSDATVEFVDYNTGPVLGINNKTLSNKKTQILRFIKKGKIGRLISYKSIRKEYGELLSYYLNVGKNNNINPNLDCLVIGSDEVFNCFQGNPKIGYTLDLFGKNASNSKRIVSYAASFGNTNIDKINSENKNIEITECLNNFHSLSVRDENSLSVIQTLTGRNDISVNVDPVFLYDFDLDLTINQVKTRKKKYIVVYAYSGRISDNESKVIKEFAKKNNFEVICLGYPQCFGKFVTGNPFEVVNYLRQASFVLTDTFHGAVFSIKYNLNFAAMIRGDEDVSTGRGNKEKLSFLLKQFNLLDRRLTKIDDIEVLFNTKIQFDDVNEFLKKERNKALAYLEAAIFDEKYGTK